MKGGEKMKKRSIKNCLKDRIASVQEKSKFQKWLEKWIASTSECKQSKAKKWLENWIDKDTKA